MINRYLHVHCPIDILETVAILTTLNRKTQEDLIMHIEQPSSPPEHWPQPEQDPDAAYDLMQAAEAHQQAQERRRYEDEQMARDEIALIACELERLLSRIRAFERLYQPTGLPQLRPITTRPASGEWPAVRS
jgi:hypothetical protein